MATAVVLVVILVALMSEATGLPNVCTINAKDDGVRLLEMKRVWCLLRDVQLSPVMTDPNIPSLDYQHILKLGLYYYSTHRTDCVRSYKIIHYVI